MHLVRKKYPNNSDTSLTSLVVSTEVKKSQLFSFILLNLLLISDQIFSPKCHGLWLRKYSGRTFQLIHSVYMMKTDFEHDIFSPFVCHLHTHTHTGASARTSGEQYRAVCCVRNAYSEENGSGYKNQF